MTPFIGIGRAVMFVSAMQYFPYMLLTRPASREPAPAPVESAESAPGPEAVPVFLDLLRIKS